MGQAFRLTRAAGLVAAHATRRAGRFLPTDDWDSLLESVVARLRQGLSEPQGDAAELHETVRRCVPVLDRLRASLAQERGYGRRIEAELRDTCAAPPCHACALFATGPCVR
jgi:hypothetical protein